MIVMPADTCNRLVYLWQGRYGCLGWLLNTYHAKQKPWHEMPYAIDNGAFIAFTKGEPWDEALFLAGIKKISKAGIFPLFIVVPDVVEQREATIALWHEWAPRLRAMWPGAPLAFVAQDGMTPADVPKDAEAVFIGGSDAFKAAALSWCPLFPWVHVGRVNTYRHLCECQDAGAKSVDGTGWFRGGEEDNDQLTGLHKWLSEQPRRRTPEHQSSFFGPLGAAMEHGSPCSGTAELALCGDKK